MFRKVILSFEYVGQWSKKWLDVSMSFPHKQRGLRQPWKLCRNLCSRMWLKPKCNLVIILVAFGSWQISMLFGLDRMNFKILLLKTPTLSELWISGSRLFHSFIVEGKKEFLKKLSFVRIWEILSEFLVKYLEVDGGTNWKR